MGALSEIGKAITPGGRIGDASPVGTPGGRQNWVDRAGGLPRYIRMVAHAFMRKGRDESSAIKMAVGVIRNWAEGKGNVTPKVRAAAAATMAEWEAKRAGGAVAKLYDEIEKILIEAEFEEITKALVCKHNIAVMKTGCTLCQYKPDENVKADLRPKKKKKSKVSKAGFNPKEPRDPHTGRWINVPGGHILKEAADSFIARPDVGSSVTPKRFKTYKGAVTHLRRNSTYPTSAREKQLGRPTDRKKRVKKREFSQKERMKLKAQGKTDAHGGFPLTNATDVENAVRAIGRAANPALEKRRIVAAAKKFGCMQCIPDSWSVAKSLTITAEEFENLVAEIDADDEASDEFFAEGEIEKSDDDKQLVFGWCSIAKRADGTVVVDKQGDVLEDIDQMEKVAYDFVLHSRDGGEMHVRKGVSTLVESFVSTPEKWQAMGIPEGTLPVGWWVGFHVIDKRVWQDVKSGKYRMFSVHGSGLRKALEE